MQKYSFRRSLVGYNHALVNNLIEKENADFGNTLKELRKQLAGEVHHLELLRVEIEKIKNEAAAYQSLENEISRLVLGFYMEAVEKVYGAMKEAEQIERGSAEKVLIKKSELVSLKAAIDSIKEEVSLVTNRFKVEIEKIGGDNLARHT